MRSCGAPTCRPQWHSGAVALHNPALRIIGVLQFSAKRRVRKGDVAGTHEDWSGGRPPARTHRRAPAQADTATAVRDQEDGFKRPQDGSRRCPPIQSPPCHCLAAVSAGLRQIACKELRHLICKVTPPRRVSKRRYLRGFAPRKVNGAALRVLAPPPQRGGSPKKVASNFPTLDLATPRLGQAQ
jgi:hypothetical protein